MSEFVKVEELETMDAMGVDWGAVAAITGALVASFGIGSAIAIAVAAT